MVITVRDLLDHSSLKGAILLAGEAGLDGHVTQVAPHGCRALWEAASERVLALYDPDPTGFHDPGESGLTLAGGRIAGVVCKPDAFSSVSSDLLNKCARHGVPLLVLPPERSWLEVYPPLLATLDRDANADPIREAFLRVTLAGGGMHGLLELLRWLAENPVLLISPSMQVLDHSGRNRFNVDMKRVTQLATEVVAGAGLPGSGNVDVASGPVLGSGNVLATLCLLKVDRPLCDAARTALGRAAEFASWQQLHDSRRRLDWHARTHFLTELLLGRFRTAHSARAWASTLGVQLAPCYLVMVVMVDELQPETGKSTSQWEGNDIIKDRIADIVDDLLVSTGNLTLAVGFSDSVAVAIGFPATITQRDAQSAGRKLATRIRTSVSQGFRNVTVTIGIGQLVESLADLPKGYSQARQIAALGRQLHGKSGSHSLADLGFFRLVSRIEDREFLDDFARDVLGPLVDHDASGQAPILPTLESFLTADGNRLRCAKALFLHPNTVSYRLSLIENLTGLSPFRTEDRFLIQTALKVRQYLDVIADDGIPAPLHIGEPLLDTSRLRTEGNETKRSR